MSCLFLPYNLPVAHGDVPKPCSLPTTTNMTASTSAITTEMMDYDQQLSQLLGNMTIQNAWRVVPDMPSEHTSAAFSPPAAQDSFMSDSSDSEDSHYQARCPSPLLLSAPLLTFDNLDLLFNVKAKSPKAKAHRKRAVRLRTSTSYSRPIDLGPLPYHRRRVPGSYLHSPRGVPRLAPATPRLRSGLQRPCELPREEGLEARP